MHIIGVTGLSRSGKDTVANYIVENYGYKKVAFADVMKQACALMLDRPLIDMYEGDREALSTEWGLSFEEYFFDLVYTPDKDKQQRYLNAFEILMSSPFDPNTINDVLPKRDYSFMNFLHYIENFKVVESETFSNGNKGFSIRQFLQFMGTEVLRNFRDDFHVVRLGLEIDKLDGLYKGVTIADLRFENEATFIRNNGGVIIKVERDGLKKMNHVSEAGITLTENDFIAYNNGTLDELYRTVKTMLSLEIGSYDIEEIIDCK